MKKIEETLPERLEREILREFPGIEELVDQLTNLMLQVPEPYGGVAPEWCTVPMSICGSALQIAGVGCANKYRYASKVDILTAVLAWRKHKIIYTFDESLADELRPSITEAIRPPKELLMKATYPCVYIHDLPGLPEVDGAFLLLDYDPRCKDDIQLYIIYCFKNHDVVSAYRQWGKDINKEALPANGRWLKVESEYLDRINRDNEYKALVMKCLNRWSQHLNMFLYLCSDEPDITRDAPLPRIKGEGIAKKAARVDVVSVGRYIGAALRKAAADEKVTIAGDGTRNVRPHMRRAHWCLYWTGKGRKIPRVKWLQPVFVNGEGQETPTSIHEVLRMKGGRP